MTSAATTVESDASNHISRRQLIRAGVLAILTASAVNGLVLELALTMVDVPSTFEPLPLGWGPVVASFAVGAVGATVAYGIIAGYSTRPNWTFTKVAAIVWVLSYANLLTPALAGAPAVVYAILGLMHLTTGVTIVGVLRRVPTHQDAAAEDPR
ncbi:DUF6069 family protein [Haladaptatus sp. SPP-AMP-3]|uniref:DUF6069 family protein n=1 Tax=Haladaptatus sp. SPP-AMP-3 TaxID=3121295 RepID=UPI003C2FF656